MRSIAALFIAFAATSAVPVAPATAQHAFAADADDARRLLARVERAKRLLDGRAVGTAYVGGTHAVLAVGRVDDGPIRAVHVRGGVSRTPGFDVVLRSRNGVNSRYEVRSPEGMTVLAIKTNVRDRTSRRRWSRSAVYVPYGPELHTPAIERHGRAYLDDVIRRAASELDDRDVRSLDDPRQRVTDVVSPRILLTLLAIEHVGPREFHDLGAERAVAEVFVTVALNGADTYRHSFSSANAGGLAQFIRSTYAATRTAYPSAELPRSFLTGMRDHVRAVMAQYCLVDLEMSRLPTARRRRLADEEDLGAYVAAAYNGGSSRALEAMRRFPVSWERRGRGLARQTVTYVRKFRAAYRVLGDASPRD